MRSAPGSRPRRRAMAAAGIAAGLLLVGGATFARAAEIHFTASVDQTTVGLGQGFQLVLSVQGEDVSSVPRPTLPAMAGFDVAGRSSSQSTNISLVNGQMKKEATVSYIFELVPKQLGKATIPAATIDYQGRTYTTQPIEMTVVKQAQGQASPMGGGGGAGAGIPATRGQVPIEGNLLLSVTPSRRSAYVGEPIAVDVALATRFQISNASWAQVPSFEGFWAEKVFEANRFDFERRMINGKAFGVADLQKVVLVPLSPGDVTLKPMALNVEITTAPRDIFDMFGGSQAVRVDSKPLTLKILPLPQAGKPAEFTGGVGQFTLSAALDRTSTTNGEPINLTVRVTGTGNIRMIDAPKIAEIQGLKILAPEAKDDAKAVGESVRGTKTFRFPILPQSDGRFEIPPIALAYFDPHTKSYKTLTSDALSFTASGSTVPNAPIAAEQPSGLKVLGSDISYIKPDVASLSPQPMDVPWWPNLMVAGSLAMVGLAFGYRGHRQRLQTDRGYARLSRSSGLVRKRLKVAEQLLKKNDVKGFHAELTRALVGYLGDRFDLDTHALTRDQLRVSLAGRGVPSETLDQVLDIVDHSEVARFSPGAAGDGDPRALFVKARDVMARL